MSDSQIDMTWRPYSPRRRPDSDFYLSLEDLSLTAEELREAILGQSLENAVDPAHAYKSPSLRWSSTELNFLL
ncbi:MAG: hypothetical protein A49_11710 [Methyloceanibacter sp.]|nr:MAG: hypothetical protein A49_11710 [Methyloceanibacter sp.]